MTRPKIELCPTCGGIVTVESGDEGTSHYRPTFGLVDFDAMTEVSLYAQLMIRDSDPETRKRGADILQIINGGEMPE